MNYDSKQFLQLRFDVIELCKGNPLDMVVWSRIFGWENSKGLSKVKLTQEYLADFVGVSIDSIQRSLKRLKDAGLVGVKVTSNGSFYTTRKDVIEKFQKPQNAVSEHRKLRQPTTANCGKQKPQIAVSHISRSSLVEVSSNKTTTTTSSLSSRETSPTTPKFPNPYRPRPTQTEPEPFEMTPEPESRLLNPSMYRVDRTPPEFEAVKIPEQIRARIQGVLGTDSVARWIRQEHIDSGFINYALDACSGRKVQRPAGLFMSLLRDEYRPGWQSPEETLRLRQEERLAEIEF